MKTISTLVTFLILSLTSFSQTYRIYTAARTGNWNSAATWNNVVRTDGISKNRYVIPSAYTVTATNGTDYTTLGDIEVSIAGILNIAPNTVFGLTQNSSIEIPLNGELRTNGIGVVMIGNSWKLLTFSNRTIDGPVFTNFATIGFASGFLLSVDFLSFTASSNGNNIDLKWNTANETNNSHFDVEVSVNGKDWSKVGIVKGSIATTAANNYRFTHYNASGLTLSYRLKQVDIDGKIEYSTVAFVKANLNSQINITSNHSAVNIEFASEIKSTVAIRLMNSNGQVVLTKTANRPSGRLTINTTGMKTGIYVVHVSTTTHSEAKQVVIN